MPDSYYTKPTGPKFVDLTGRTFARLTVAAYAGKSPCGMTRWECLCDCGETTVVPGKHLKSGATRSCGCWSREVAAERQKVAGQARRATADPMAPPNDPRFIDLAGHRYGMLAVEKYAGRGRNGSHSWECLCECGTRKVIRGCHMKSGLIRSCGCEQRRLVGIRATTHGDSNERLYWIYRGMLQRCGDPNQPRYDDYGGRGISVCEPWRSRYAAFREWALSHGYTDELTIERIDVDGDYYPENCEWIPREMQAANKRTTVRVTAFGETKHVSAWVRDPRCVVTDMTLRRRLKRGWDNEKAITTPR